MTPYGEQPVIGKRKFQAWEVYSLLGTRMWLLYHRKYALCNYLSVVCLLSKCSFLFFLSLSVFCLSLPEPETKLIAKALL